jgi:alpha-galactosidase
LRREHPAVVFEGCSNGGRRMDLACLKRSHTFWCNDHTEHPDVVRSDLRMNLILPANYLNHVVCLKNPAADYPDYAYHCLMGGTWGFTEKLSEWPEKRIEDARRHVEVFKRYRHLLMKDFAPLFSNPQTLDEWDGWQWHDPETGAGLIVVFRCLGEDADCSPLLRWLDPAQVYEFEDPYTKHCFALDGRRLATEGLPVRLATPRTSLVLTYQPRKNEAIH